MQLARNALVVGVERSDFRAAYVRIAGMTFAVIGLVASVLFVAVGAARHVVYPIMGALVGAASAQLARASRNNEALLVLAYGITLVCAAFVLVTDFSALYSIALTVPLIVIMVQAFLASPRAVAAYAAVVVGLYALVGLQAVAQGELKSDVIVRLSTQAMLFLGTGFIAFFLRRSFEGNQSELERRLKDIDRVVVQARRVARGDLSGAVEGDNEVSEVVREMLDGLRRLVAQVQEGVQVLSISANELDAMSTQQERSAVHQAAAVTQTRQTVESLAGASQRITNSTKSVLVNAESTLRTNEQTRERLSLLANHTRRIHELLELIQDIAHKSDILALNAALEGTRAGEAGRGFSLVAKQIQQLAERTMGALADVRALMEDITAATNGTVLSMEQATKLASDTARAAREIALTSQQQGSSVGEVVTTIGDIATITTELATATKETLSASRSLRSLSDRLHTVVTRFVL